MIKDILKGLLEGNKENTGKSEKWDVEKYCKEQEEEWNSGKNKNLVERLEELLEKTPKNDPMRSTIEHAIQEEKCYREKEAERQRIYNLPENVAAREAARKAEEEARKAKRDAFIKKPAEEIYGLIYDQLEELKETVESLEDDIKSVQDSSKRKYSDLSDKSDSQIRELERERDRLERECGDLRSSYNDLSRQYNDFYDAVRRRIDL